MSADFSGSWQSVQLRLASTEALASAQSRTTQVNATCYVACVVLACVSSRLQRQISLPEASASLLRSMGSLGSHSCSSDEVMSVLMLLLSETTQVSDCVHDTLCARFIVAVQDWCLIDESCCSSCCSRVDAVKVCDLMLTEVVRLYEMDADPTGKVI